MTGTIDEVFQMLRRLPNGHIHEHERILGPRMLRVGSVTGRGLKSPNESLGAFSESIDGIEPVHEFSDLRVIKRMQQSPHIQLRDMKVHKLTSIVLQASQSHDRPTPKSAEPGTRIGNAMSTARARAKFGTG